MSFDFDTVVPRRGTDSAKWEASDDPAMLPMWVADMDFRTAPVVVEALQRRVAHGVFGYTRVPEAWFEAVQAWSLHRHGLPISRSAMLYTSGVVPAISAILRALTHPGDKVLLQTPVYNCFFSSVRNLGCQVVESPLRQVGDRFEMDFEDLEARLADRDLRVLILCNPHNPVGRAWTREELTRLDELAARHGVTVVSDEIHRDLVVPGHTHQAFAALGPETAARSITCSSPSKAFNLAGLQIASIVVEDPDLRARVDKALNVHEVCDVNPFGVVATIAAYTRGGPWLDALNGYLGDNRRLVEEFFAARLHGLHVTPGEATYLAWIDARTLGVSSAQLVARLAGEGRVLLSAGTAYGAAGEGYLRLNMACPRAILVDGLERIASVLG